MSFILTVTLSPNDNVTEESLTHWGSPNAKVKFKLGKSIFSKRAQVLSIETVKGGSSQYLLTDNADPDAQYWDMQREFLPEIASLLKILRQNTKSDFVFQAYWAGEKVTEQKEVSIDEMAKIIEAGEIGTRTKYLVH